MLRQGIEPFPPPAPVIFFLVINYGVKFGDSILIGEGIGFSEYILPIVDKYLQSGVNEGVERRRRDWF